MKKDYDSIYNSIIHGEFGDIHSVLGFHKINKIPSITAYIPGAQEVSVLKTLNDEAIPMTKIRNEGIFKVEVDKSFKNVHYYLLVKANSGNEFTIIDPYTFWPTISDHDLYLFGEGNYHKAYLSFGSHFREIDGIKGVSFIVWAPNAKKVSVVGAFNQWDGRRHQMRILGETGVWEIFIPNLCNGDTYKFEIKTPNGELYYKSDPYAFYSQKRPETASIVYDIKSYEWDDAKWMKKREKKSSFEKPVNIYEVHLGSWAQIPDETEETGYRFLTYLEYADRLIEYVKKMNYTYIELMPISEHPFDGSWGYQVTGYYAITSRYGTPKEFMNFVDQCHQNNIGVIVDWVPAHFPKDGHGLPRFDGKALYEHEHPIQGEHPQWGTHIFNYGRPEVKNFLISNALFLVDMYHLDGLRVDAVASILNLNFCREDGQWMPNKYGGNENIEGIQFIKQMNYTVYKYFPNIMMIAEDSSTWPMVTQPVHIGGLGFSYKWNMGWMNDFLEYCELDFNARSYNSNLITFSMMYSTTENFILILSHDEVVHGKKSMIEKMPGDYWQKFAGLRGVYGFFIGHPGKKLLFMGSEYGQFIEWKYRESLDWHLLDYPMHKKMHDYIMDLNKLYITIDALYEDDFEYSGFQWIECTDNTNCVFSFIRRSKKNNDYIIVITNFTPATHENYRLGLPEMTAYIEVFNSDKEIYGGSGVENKGDIIAENKPWQNQLYSTKLRVPPLSSIFLLPKSNNKVNKLLKINV